MTPTPYPAPGPATAPPPSPAVADGRSTGGRGRRWAALVVALAGVVGGVALWLTATARHDDGVRSLARAPVGCDTTLDFAETGEYLVFVETRGEFADVRGDCELRGTFDLAGAAAPTPDVQVVDPGGDEVALLSRRGREEYDRAGSQGESFARITIEEAGDHVVRVESAGDTAFAVAIGRDPADGVALLRLVGVGVALVGLVVALVLALSGRTKRPASTTPVGAPPPEFGASAWGVPPPSGPPPMQPPQGPPPPTAPSWMPPPPGAPSTMPPQPSATGVPGQPPPGMPPQPSGSGVPGQPPPPTSAPSAPTDGPTWPTVPWPTTSDPSPWDDAAATSGGAGNAGGTGSPPDGDGDGPSRLTPPG